MWAVFLGYRENEIEHHLLCNGYQSESKMPLIDPEESAKRSTPVSSYKLSFRCHRETVFYNNYIYNRVKGEFRSH